MYRYLTSLNISFIILFLGLSTYSQIPPGWEFTVTPTNHLFVIPQTAWPVINSNPIEVGDYIGVFYTDNGELKCGGAFPWPADNGTILFVYGDDAITSEKDGFDYGEEIQWKIYSWSMLTEVSAAIQHDPTYPTTGDVFVPEGMSGVINISGGGFFIFAYATPENVCWGDSTQLHADPYGGSGNYTYSWTSEPPGFTSTLQNPMVQINDTTVYTVVVNDGTYTASDDATANPIPIPNVYAGDDHTICASMNYSCNAQKSHTSSIDWSSSGDGTFNFVHSPTAVYTPGPNDIVNGYVSLFLAGYAIDPCDYISYDTLELTILQPPTALAGEDKICCENATIELIGSANHYSSLLWTTNGTGTFTSPTSLSTNYITEEINEPTNINITLQVTGNAPCGIAYDDLSISINPMAECNAGDNQTICESETLLLNGTAQYFTALQWESRGDGTFINGTQLNAEYQPGPEDITAGNTYLILEAASAAPCSEVAIDSILLTIQPQPTAFAGYDQQVCEGGDILLNGYTESATSFAWSTSGDGVFSNIHILNPFYTPGESDISNGTVLLQLTADPIGPCAVSASDEMEVFIHHQPTANAGEDGQICMYETFQTDGTIFNGTQMLWTTSGTGTFTDPSQPFTEYIPSSNDYLNGETTLYLTATASQYCPAHTDSLTLTYIEIPEVYAGNDQVIPYGTFTTLQGNITGGSGNYTQLWNPADLLIGPSTLTPTTVNMEATTVFTLTGTDALLGCTANDAVTIFVSGGPLSVLCAATPQEICPGESVQLSAIPSGGAGTYTYTWESDPAGFSTAEPNPFAYPTQTTTYTVTVDDGFNTAQAEVTVVVHDRPVANAGLDQSIPNGAAALLSGSATGGSGNYFWLWKPAGKVINPAMQQTSTTQLYSNQRFILTATDQETSCYDIDTIQVFMSTSPLVVNPVADPEITCVGEPIQLHANAEGGTEEYTYSWYSEPPGYFSDLENPVITPQQALRMWVDVSDGENTAQGFADIAVYQENIVFITRDPNDTICADGTIELAAQSQLEVLSYYWLPTEETTQTITIDSTGFGIGHHEIQVVVTDINDCVTTKSAWIDIKVCVGEAELPVEANQIEVYPNPAQEKLIISVPTAYYAGALELYQISSGKMIYTMKIPTGGAFSFYPKWPTEGIYLLVIRQSNLKPMYKKVIFKK